MDFRRLPSDGLRVENEKRMSQFEKLRALESGGGRFSVRALIQRVKWAKVSVDGKVVGEIGPGILTLLGIKNTDTEKEADWTIQKVSKLRIFEDDAGKMNLSLLDLQAAGEKVGHLLVSQFTLYGDTEQGNRPGFAEAARPDIAQKLYEKALLISRGLGIETQAGTFQAHMEVSLLNDGPATFWVESST